MYLTINYHLNKLYLDIDYHLIRLYWNVYYYLIKFNWKVSKYELLSKFLLVMYRSLVNGKWIRRVGYENRLFNRV